MRLSRVAAASAAVMLLLPSAASAELLRVELKIFGMDCATCAYSVKGKASSATQAIMARSGSFMMRKYRKLPPKASICGRRRWL